MSDREQSTTVEILYESPRSRVSRIQLSGRDDESAIRKEIVGPEAARRLRSEQSILERLRSVHGIVQLLEVDEQNNALILDDRRATALSAVLESTNFELEQLFDLAKQLTNILISLHERGVVHRDINPTNVLIDQHGQACLVDFNLASAFSGEHPNFVHESKIIGTLAYMAPEQTGRTSWRVDHRADLYGLGATLYEVATGSPPFRGDDPLQLIRAHLTQVPANPSDVNPGIPRMFSEVILRLMEKDPGRRYQSARGLLYDLEKLQHSDAPFGLGYRDFPLRLTAPSKLVGRDDAVAILTDAFHAAVRGDARALFVSGDPGVGKSSLIDELRPVVTGLSGWFISGAFDQYRPDQGANALYRALGSLGQLLLSENAADLALYRAQFKEVLGLNATLAARVIPEFAAILQLSSTDLDAQSSNVEGRLGQTFCDILGVVVSRRPIALVIDDLQWAGPESLDILDVILTDERLSSLLVVGAYRQREVDAAHPLTAMLDRWRRLNVGPQVVRLENLPSDDVVELLAQILRIGHAPARDLAGLIAPRTAGNPFDTVEFLNSLRQHGVLKPTDDGWSWDDKAVALHLGGGDVTGLIRERIENLPGATAVLLKQLSCLGGEADFDVLAKIAGASTEEVQRLVTPALEQGLLLVDQSQVQQRIGFRHDRIQQSAIKDADSEELSTLRLEIARRLSADETYAGIAAEQYISASAELDDAEERRRVIGLYRQASERTRITNHTASEQYLAAALDLLGTPESADEEALAIDLQVERHAALYRLGRFEEADVVYAALERRWQEDDADEEGASHSEGDLLQRSEAAYVQVSSYIYRGNPGEGLNLGIKALRPLGINLPSEADLGAEIVAGTDAFYEEWNANDQTLSSTAIAEFDPTVFMAGKLLNRVGVAAWYSDLQAVLWLVLESRRRWVSYGPYPPFIATSSALIVATLAIRGDYKTGYLLGRQAAEVAAANEYEPETSYCRYMWGLLAMHWGESLEDVVAMSRRARDGLLRSADLEDACFTYHTTLAALTDTAADIDVIKDEFDASLALTRRTGNDQAELCHYTFRQMYYALKGTTASPGSFEDDFFEEAKQLELMRPNGMGMLYYHSYRGLAAAIFGDFKTVEDNARQAMAYIPYAPCCQPAAIANFVQALTAAWAIQQSGSIPSEGESLATLEGCTAWLEQRAAEMPDNYQSLFEAISAEKAWAMEGEQAAAHAFDRALAGLSSRRPWQRAFVTERAARFHLRIGLRHAGMQLLLQALEFYRSWGATGKVSELEREFPSLQKSHRVHFADTPAGGSVGESLFGASADTIDLMAVLEVSRTLSSETSIDQLRTRLEELLSVMTGATKVTLALWNSEAKSWYLEAGDATSVRLDDPSADTIVPVSAFRYAERTKSALLVENAVEDSRFSRDPYFADVEQCSLLVVPVTRQGVQRAMLVLENRAGGGTFTPDRLDAVVLVAAQLAVSIENALAERFRSLVQQSSDLTLVCDGSEAIIYASSAASLILGTDPTELAQRCLKDIVHEEDYPALSMRLGVLDVAAKQAAPDSLQCRVVRGDGSLRWVDVNVSDLRADPAIGGFVLYLRDVTERRRAEAELRHAQKLKSVGKLSAGVAHEINTPIQFIQSNLRFLAESFDQLTGIADNAQQAEQAIEQLPDIDLEFLVSEVPVAIREAVAGVERIASIVAAMKVFGESEVDVQKPHDINESVQNTLVVANSQIEPVANVVTDLAELPHLTCNPGDINEVMLNLVTNAAEAIAEKQASVDGQVRKGTLRVRTRQEGSNLVLEVEDDGVGIPGNIEDRVFEPFFTTKPVGSGMGQGLAVTYSIVHDRYHGSIEFVSEPGVGTTFVVRLPLNQSS